MAGRHAAIKHGRRSSVGAVPMAVAVAWVGAASAAAAVPSEADSAPVVQWSGPEFHTAPESLQPSQVSVIVAEQPAASVPAIVPFGSAPPVAATGVAQAATIASAAENGAVIGGAVGTVAPEIVPNVLP